MQQKVEGYLSGAKNGTDCDDNTENEHSTDHPTGDNLEGVTNIKLEARLTKLQDGWNNNLKERFNEYLDYNEETFKKIEKETDRLLDDRENRLEAKITNIEQMTKKQTTDLENRLGLKITNPIQDIGPV